MNERYVRYRTKGTRINGNPFTVAIVGTGCAEVQLISHMIEPELLLAKVSRTYKGILSAENMSDEEIAEAFSDANKTKLGTPKEMLYTVFLVKNVSRAFTHQMVRTRMASYAQESMRFLGAKDEYYVHIAPGMDKDNNFDLYCATAVQSIIAYDQLVDQKVNSEKARGILPTNILTSIFIGISISSLAHVYETRMCCQAQPGEWQDVMGKMKEQVEYYMGGNVASLLSAPYERGEPCGYRASYDRPCIWQKGKNDETNKNSFFKK